MLNNAILTIFQRESIIAIVSSNLNEIFAII